MTADTLDKAENSAENLFSKIEQLLEERNILRGELARKSDSNLDRDKAFVRAYKENIFSAALASDKIAKLEHFLTI